MADISNEKMGREARATVGARRPTTGENRVQHAMRLYLGAAAVQEQDTTKSDGEKRDDDKTSRKGSGG